ncbi:MAG: radical SAM protein [Fimbriimonadaceae bacterium]|nr:radical SAM protein [Fimbriimonadaceae bacterium]
MADVLLASSYFLQLDPKQVRKMRPFPPLGTLYAAAVLRSAGYEVALYDAMLQPDEATFGPVLERARPRYVVFFEDSFNFLSKMCLTRMREATLAMAAQARAAGAVVLAAGSDASDRAELYLAGGVDYVLPGEADHTVRELLRALQQPGAPVAEVAGLVYQANGAASAPQRTPAREPERHPDVFGEPAWDLVDIEAYRAVWRQHHGAFWLNLVSTRGCPFHCNWCAKPIWGQRYAMRSAAAVAAEMARLKRDFAPDHLWFADDIFGLRPAWVVDFAAAVQAQDAATPFTIQSRVDLMTPEAVTALAAAGCREVWLGAESGSQQVLDAMDKGTRLDDIRAARQRLRAAGIRACFFIQFGYPGETLADIQATVELVRECLPDDIGVSVSYPLPGTAFHERIAEQLHEKTNWVHSDDLAMLFAGAYETEFYRHLHTTLHHDLVVHQRAATGRLAADDLARLAELWFELGRLEPQHHNRRARQLPAHAALAPPDLSREYN